jgi:hypothetical protein
MKEVKNVSVQELVNILMTVNKPTFCFVKMETDFRMNKTGNEFFGRVKKETTNRYLLAFDYQSRVNNNMVNEDILPEFVSQKPSGRTHVSKCVTVDDKTNSVYYVNLEYFKENKPNVNILLDGEIVTDVEVLTDINEFKVKSSFGTSQPQERKVLMLTPKIENITFISINGIRYTIVK